MYAHNIHTQSRAAVGPDRSRSSLNLQNLELCTNAVEHHNGQFFCEIWSNSEKLCLLIFLLVVKLSYFNLKLLHSHEYQSGFVLSETCRGLRPGFRFHPNTKSKPLNG